MRFTKFNRGIVATVAAVSALTLTLSACGGGGGEPAATGEQEVEITFLVDNNEATISQAESIADAFTAANPTITVKVDTRPGGTEGDNIVKTRLATGDMADVFLYNSGSLFQAINPVQNLMPLTSEPFMSRVSKDFYPMVSVGEEQYGAPYGTSLGGGILYNKKIYTDLGLTVPTTWSEFMANNEKVKAAGKVPVIQTYKDSWTAQLFVLADYYNVQASVPTFAKDYTENKAKYASTPAALRGFTVQEQLFKAGMFNEDFGSATYDDGVRMVAEGDGAHYPMLSTAVANLVTTYSENINDVGFFAMPGENAADNGMTVWYPGGVYIPKSTKNADAAKKLVDYIASPAGCEARASEGGITGPYLVEGCTLPPDVPPIVTDIQKYFDAEKTSAALEFVSPIKGPALSEITVEVGSGIKTAAQGAKAYDEDVKKQAEQLDLPGW